MTKRIKPPKGEHQRIFYEKLDDGLERSRRSNDLEQLMLNIYLDNPSNQQPIPKHKDWLYALSFYSIWFVWLLALYAYA